MKIKKNLNRVLLLLLAFSLMLPIPAMAVEPAAEATLLPLAVIDDTEDDEYAAETAVASDLFLPLSTDWIFPLPINNHEITHTGRIVWSTSSAPYNTPDAVQAFNTAEYLVIDLAEPGPLPTNAAGRLILSLQAAATNWWAETRFFDAGELLLGATYNPETGRLIIPMKAHTSHTAWAGDAGDKHFVIEPRLNVSNVFLTNVLPTAGGSEDFVHMLGAPNDEAVGSQQQG